MFLIALVALICFCTSYARQETLFTSSVTYCEDPDSLLVQQFDVAYIAWNESVSFNITAASVDQNVNVSANLLLSFYGMTPVNFSINLCDVLGGLLCPLPQYNFSGWDSVPLPQDLGVSNRIPGIAFKIPDLEAFTQLKLVQVETGKVKACVQATLSNGWSTFQPAVQWSTAGVALFTFVVAAWQSLNANSILSFRFVELMNLYQTIAFSALLNLNYPSAYRSFALNFAWSMGLIPSTALQSSIDRMRHLTGGTMANSTAGSAVGFVNRKLSPYNVPPGLQTNLASYNNMLDLSSGMLSRIATSHSRRAEGLNILSSSTEVQTVTDTSSNVLQAGIPIYANSVHIATANAFMTVFLCVLILLAIGIAMFLIGYLCILVMERRGWGDTERCVELRYNYRSFFRAWLLRLSLIIFLPATTFAFYQWTLKDSWLSILISVIFLLITFMCISFSAYRTIRLAKSATPYALYSHPNHLINDGPLYAQYRIPRYHYFLITLGSSLLKAIFIAFGAGSGLAQLILLLIVELGGMVSLFLLRPYRSKGAQAFAIFLNVIRFICAGLMLAFEERLGVSPIIRTVIGLIVAVIFSVTVIVVILNLVINLGWNYIYGVLPKRLVGSTAVNSDDAAMLERGDEKVDDKTPSQFSYATRPRNPTPERNIPLDPEIRKDTYPVTPTTTDLSTSGSTNFGSVLPRRWTFTPLHSPVSSATQLDEQSSQATKTPESPSVLGH